MMEQPPEKIDQSSEETNQAVKAIASELALAVEEARSKSASTERRDFILGTLLALCMAGILFMPVLEIRAGGPLDASVKVLEYLKEFVLMILTGYFAISMPTHTTKG